MKAFLHHQKAVLYAMAVFIVAGVVTVFTTRPPQAAFWIGVVVFGFGIIASIASVLLGKKKSKTLFDERPMLSDDEIYRQYFAEVGLPQALVLELWREVAGVLNLPAGKLRPTDRFGQELGGYWITSEELDALGDVAAARARRHNATLNLAEIKTLDEYVRRFAAISTTAK
jgi:hypothetical protein